MISDYDIFLAFLEATVFLTVLVLGEGLEATGSLAAEGESFLAKRDFSLAVLWG